MFDFGRIFQWLFVRIKKSKCLSLSEASAILNGPESYLDTLFEKKSIPYERIESQIQIRYRDLMKYKKQRDLIRSMGLTELAAMGQKCDYRIMGKLTLRQVNFSEQEKIYQWLACSDATAEMLGPPNYPDAPIPSYQEFCNDYNQEAFSPSGDFRLFIIGINATEIGALSYYVREKVAEFDIWIASRSHWNRGWGSTALLKGISIVKQQETVDFAIIRPSARNKRAISAYCKAGFEHYDPNTNLLPSWCLTEGKDYEDAALLFQKIN